MIFFKRPPFFFFLYPPLNFTPSRFWPPCVTWVFFYTWSGNFFRYPSLTSYCFPALHPFFFTTRSSATFRHPRFLASVVWSPRNLVSRLLPLLLFLLSYVPDLASFCNFCIPSCFLPRFLSCSSPVYLFFELILLYAFFLSLSPSLFYSFFLHFQSVILRSVSCGTFSPIVLFFLSPLIIGRAFANVVTSSFSFLNLASLSLLTSPFSLLLQDQPLFRDLWTLHVPFLLRLSPLFLFVFSSLSPSKWFQQVFLF